MPASQGDANDCIVDKIDQFAKELASRDTSFVERRMALEFLLHFIGDLHQPLHASNDHDKGGNEKKVLAPAAIETNLHSYWDTTLVRALGHDDASIASDLIASITSTQLSQWRQGVTADWAKESFLVAQTQAYGKLPSPQADGRYVLDTNYLASATNVVHEQLSKAGVRLAMVLNQTLGKSNSNGSGPLDLLGNGGFENVPAHPDPWSATNGVVNSDPEQSPHTGAFNVWLNGYGQASTDSIEQKVSIPPNAGGTPLSFWLHVDTDEPAMKANDTMSVQVLNSAGKLPQTLATCSNLDAVSGYMFHHLDLSAFSGRTIVIKFKGRENASKRTSFMIDDVSVNAAQ